jgi:1,4-dihydroxy-2-naphthoyl-CoA synthase
MVSTKKAANPMKTIRFERRDSVGSIVLANPPYNRIDARFPVTLREALHEASASDIRVLVVRAEGPNFSFGGEVREWPGRDVNWFRTFVAEVNASYRALEALRIPTVAVVQGVAFGGGFELALACDSQSRQSTCPARYMRVSLPRSQVKVSSFPPGQTNRLRSRSKVKSRCVNIPFV